MADAILSVPGHFLTCVQYFELVRLGRNFDTDFESNALLLRSTELRLRRWGEAVGITDRESITFQAAIRDRSDEDLDYVDEALDHIKTRLETAKDQAVKFAKKRRQRPTEAMVELETIDEISRASTAGTIQSRSIIRLRKVVRKTLDFGTDLQKSTTWALYRKTELTNLVRDITEHVAILEQYLPGRLAELTQADAVQLAANAPKEEVATIAGAAMTTDPKFAEALTTEGAKTCQNWGEVSLRDYVVMRLGNDFAKPPESGTYSQSWAKIDASGHAQFRAGNNYGYDNSVLIHQAQRDAEEAERAARKAEQALQTSFSQ